MYPVTPPPPVPEKILEGMHAADAARASQTVEDADDMRDEPSSLGSGGWLVVLLCLLGVVALVLVMAFLAGAL